MFQSVHYGVYASSCFYYSAAERHVLKALNELTDSFWLFSGQMFHMRVKKNPPLLSHTTYVNTVIVRFRQTAAHLATSQIKLIPTNSLHACEKQPASVWQRCWPVAATFSLGSAKCWVSDVVWWLWRLVHSPCSRQETFPPETPLRSAITWGKVSLKHPQDVNCSLSLTCDDWCED